MDGTSRATPALARQHIPGTLPSSLSNLEIARSKSPDTPPGTPEKCVSLRTTEKREILCLESNKNSTKP